MEEQGSTTQNERVLAALAHGSILLATAFGVALGVALDRGGIVIAFGIGFFSGPSAALLIWLVHRGESAYVAAQALQALVYQLAVLVVTVVGGIGWFALLVLVGRFDIGDPPAWLGPALIAFPIGVLAPSILYALWGAESCLRGHDFSYAIVGRWAGGRA